jgi:lysophospholipase L1-like esterase
VAALADLPSVAMKIVYAEMPSTHPRRSVYAGLLLAAIVFELTARLLFAVRPPPPVANLQAYQMRDPDRPWHIRLRPGLVETYAEAAEFKRQTRRVLGEQYLAELRADPAQIWIRINRDGFRGPEIDSAHAAPRIVTIGDSCTFGMGESSSYPRVLEASLRRRGIVTEVVNAGVEGYTSGDVLIELGRLKALRPDVTTVYLGWNGFFNQEQVFGHPALATWRLIRGAARGLATRLRRPDAVALEAYSKPKHPDAHARDVTGLDGFVPVFFTEIRQIVREMRSTGSRVVLLTLPGLYELDREPTEHMLRIGHLPTYTDNPYVLAKLSARLNDLLRQLAREESADLIDIEAWSLTALKPREHYFFDSVHLTDEGQEMLGRYLADRFPGLLASQSRRSASLTLH